MSPDSDGRPNVHDYFMTIAMAVRRRANCLGARVGSVLVKDGRIVSTGYNGTPSGMPNCLEGGCKRCGQPDQFEPGTGYDLCICVHAEQNALLAAARFGISVEGASVYCTMRPCFGCTKELLQTKISAVYYLHEWKHPNPVMREQQEQLTKYFSGGMQQLDMEDPDAEWALSRRSLKTPPLHGDETGHVG